jgi:hypothetical protein
VRLAFSLSGALPFLVVVVEPLVDVLAPPCSDFNRSDRPQNVNTKVMTPSKTIDFIECPPAKICKADVFSPHSLKKSINAKFVNYLQV